MTTGFQQQHQTSGPILKSAAKPQHVGAKLLDKEPKRPTAPRQPTSFKTTRP
jgi:hypothetical protein